MTKEELALNATNSYFDNLPSEVKAKVTADLKLYMATYAEAFDYALKTIEEKYVSEAKAQPVEKTLASTLK